jgi:hypothetical protein
MAARLAASLSAASARDGSQTDLRAAFANGPSQASPRRCAHPSILPFNGSVASIAGYAASTARPALRFAIPHEAETRETAQHHRHAELGDRNRRKATVAGRDRERREWAGKRALPSDTYMCGLRPRRSSRRPAERLQPTQRRHRSLDSTLRLPRPQRVPQRVDAEVGGGGLGAKGG